MSIKGKWFNGILSFFESATAETVLPVAPCVQDEDFLGNTTLPARWTAKDVSSAGLTTPITVASGANGLADLMLDATSEAQESGLYFGDQRPFVLNQGLIIEFRAALHTLPTGNAALVMGLAGNYNADPDTVAESLWFKADASGAIVVENDDTAITSDDNATGVTVIADAFHIFKIDCTVITDVKFYIDGVRVAAATTFDASTVAGLKLQPYFHLRKASGTGLGEIYLDYVRVWQKRA